MRTIYRCAAACLTIGLTALAGCDSAADEAASAGGPGGGTFTVGVSQANLAEPYRVQMDNDIRAAAEKHPNLTMVFKDAQKDSLKKRAHVEEFVSQGVDLIIISPNEPAPLTDPVAKAVDAGIPVIVLDRQLAGDKYTTFIGADNYAIGQAAGDWLVDHLGAQGKTNVVELTGMMSTDPAQKRHAGFQDALEGSDLKVVFDADMKWDQSQSKAEMESALATRPEIDAVYAHNDPGAYGAYLAARQAGRADAITFVGIDALPQEGIAYVKDGVLDASFLYPTGGEQAVEAAVKILAGETVPKEITLGSRVFTRQNVAAGGEELPTPETPATRPAAAG